MIFINFKTYEQGTGENALHLVGVLEKVASESQIKIIPVVQAADIKEVVESTKLEVWAQHIDPFDYGAHTGGIIAEAVKEDGASGTFLNHSENKYKLFDELKNARVRAAEVDLKTLVFAADMEELGRVIDLKPMYVAYEPPELVGSKDTSVAESKPDVIEKAVRVTRIAGLPLIVGAGIKSTEDVRKSIELGAVGVAVASDIVKADDPKKELEELVQGFE